MSLPFILLLARAWVPEGVRLHTNSVVSVPVPPKGGAWRERVLTCETPWIGLKKAAEVAKENGHLKISLGAYIRNQIQERIDTQGEAIDQGWEGLCSIVSVENILAMKDPDRFANIMADLYCTGVVGKNRGLSREIRARKNVLKCSKTSTREVAGGKNSSRALYNLADPHSGKIRAVDWMFAGTFADAVNWFGTPCADGSNQGQDVANYKKVTKWVFPESEVKQKGGFWQSLGRNLTMRVQHVKRQSWETILQNVRDGGQAILGIDTSVQNWNEVLTSAGHAVVLTKVIDSTMLTDSCASSLVSDYKSKASCVIWTWATYYVFEDCDNLRKMTHDGVLVPLEEGMEKLGPKLFQNPKVLEHLEFNIRSMWLFRRTGRWKPLGLAFKYRAVKFLREQRFEFVPRIDIGRKQRKRPLVQDSLHCIQAMETIRDCLPCGLWPGRAMRLTGDLGEGIGGARIYSFDAWIHSDAKVRDGTGQRSENFHRSALLPISTLSVGHIVGFGNASTSTKARVVDIRESDTGELLAAVHSGGKKKKQKPVWVPRNDLTLLMQIGDVVSYKEQFSTVLGLTDTGLIKIRSSTTADISDVPFEDIRLLEPPRYQAACRLQNDWRADPTYFC